MRILVTGAKGFIGSRLVKRLEAEGHSTLGIDWEHGNLTYASLPDAEVVFHLAAHASVEASWMRPVDYMDNLRTTVRLVHAYPDARIIYASTCSTLNPESSPYAFSKKAAADYVKYYAKDFVTLLFPNIFGDSPRSVVDIFKHRDKVTIFGDGKQIRDYVHVDDIVSGLVKSLCWAKGEYSLGSGVGVSVLELAEGKEIEFAPARKEQREVILSNTTPDWKPTIRVKDFLCA